MTLRGAVPQATNEYIGVYSGGDGTFMRSGGTKTVDSDLYIGDGGGSQGSYTLSGTGELTTTDEHVAKFGEGSFTQTGGEHTVTDDLRIGRYVGAVGTYTISVGSLNAAQLHVGLEGSGTFEITNAAAEVTVTEYLRFGTYRNGM